MTKQRVKLLSKVLQVHLSASDRMWNDKESHAKIVGYLQGTIKGVIGELEEISK